MNPITTTATARQRRRRLLAVGVVAASLSAVGAGAATAAANPYSGAARAVESVAQAVGIDWSAMPDGYTREQYEAFWDAGYTTADVDELSALWSTDATETKARAGQLLLDGADVPIAPGSVETFAPESGADGASADAQAQLDAFWAAGYTVDDLQQLSTLWNSDATETKARAGQLLLDGQTPPVAPSGEDTTGAAS
ncbi:hypothetical protein [Pengzhenrongella sicca]|uniref:Uncharacterized protein n=1 Tax=Pengzhenrongella sicca TaxID=2819238 RepID=A0A8A4ZKY3_9MICO|nr:hypothetical protein [Pengzhenrongella sicca]QTE31177.1 hypothetical protein J4E96_09780 [Pengzhenrongella sicca]